MSKARKGKPQVQARLSSSKQQEKELKLLESLQDAETRQLESFIKSRNRELDADIKSLRSKLGASGGGSIENDSLKGVASVGLGVRGVGLGRVEFDSSTFMENMTRMESSTPAAPSLSLSLDPSRSKAQSTVRDHLVILLAKIKLKMEDVRMSPAELRELLLPSDLVLPDEHCTGIADLTGVLQTDLVLPVSKADQMMILKEYGTEQGEVNIRDLLGDAGVWFEGTTNRQMLSPERQGGYEGPARQQHYPYAPLSPQADTGGLEDRLGGLSLQGMESGEGYGGYGDSGPIRSQLLQRLDPAPATYQPRADRTSDVLGLSAHNVDDLSDLHDLILQEKEFDMGAGGAGGARKPFANFLPPQQAESDSSPVSPHPHTHAHEGIAEHKSDPRPYPHHPRADADARGKENEATNTTNAHANTNGANATTANTGELETREISALEGDRLSALGRENARLRAEIGSFDAEFFEQLEDLKFRYSRLQGIVGETPTEGGTGAPKSALPLDRLSWSVRNSMTAMDRAGLTSPLVSRPRYPNAHTYAPGGGAERGPGGGTQGGWVGGSVPASTRGSRADSLRGGEAYGSGSSGGYGGGGGGGADRDRGAPLYAGTRVADPLPGPDPLSTSQYPAPLRHKGLNSSGISYGGQHGIGAGTHSIVPNEAGGSFANLCERRLAFELAQHPAAEQATRSLIHRVMDAASRSASPGFVTCPQLAEVFRSVGLKLSPQEVELLATGFASNGQGGVNGEEFCEAVSSLLYNLLGEHAGRAGELQARRNGEAHRGGGRGGVGDEEEGGGEDVRQLMVEICEGIVTHDRRAVLGNSPNLFKTLLRPFVEADTEGSGLLDFPHFQAVLKDVGALLTQQDMLRVAKGFMVQDRAASAYPTSNLSHIQSFKDAQLRGSLRGAAQNNPVLGDWLSSSGVGLEDLYGDREGVVGGGKSNVDYTSFATLLAEILTKLLERDGGVVMGTKFPWVLREFEFVDTLICQLEEMAPSARRKVLMSLQYALADQAEADGFTVLNALLSSGFRLQRVNRVRLLRAVEEMGGKMDHRELVQVLLNSCADWTAEEKNVVKKILQAMGVTVIERRNWLARLRQSLMDASSKIARKTGRWFAGEAGSEEGAENVGIPPASFLHCLRDCGVSLDVEQEATLLDCLDTERLSKKGQAELEHGAQRESWSIPLIDYGNFLHYCARHCGSWTAAAPEVDQAVKRAAQSVSNPVLAVHELASLVAAFDETGSGSISKRAFQICCHRSRLLANLPEESINLLASTLSVDGGGSVRYASFLVYLRTTCSSLNKDNGAPDILDQLLRNGADSQGTLLPLRNWLMRNTDTACFLMTPRDVNSLLREFSVMYRPEDLEALLMDIGKHVSASAGAGGKGRDRDEQDGDQQAMKRHVIDSRDLLSALLQRRPRWTERLPYLAQRMLKAMQLAGESASASTAGLSHYDSCTGAGYNSTGGGSAGHKSAGGSRGVETAVARRVLSRLRAFAGRSAVSLGAMDGETRARDGDSLMVERDIFKHLAGVTGLPLTDEDVLVLADASDFLPEASRVRCDVILEALMGAHHSEGHSEGARVADLTEAGIYALEHLRSLLWAHAARLHRTTLEWIADVRTVFKGFDKTNIGFISSEDFSIALQLLNATVSPDLLLDISYIPEGPGLIDYADILDFVLTPPNVASPGEQLAATASRKQSVKSVMGKSVRGVKGAEKGVEEKEGDAKSRAKKVKNSPVQQLLTVVRRSLHHFIISDHSLEAAWVCLLKVFQRFDPQECNQVSPRDFCLAVSVLLDGDDVVLTKSEWAEIVQHFAQLGGTQGQGGQQRQTDFLGGASVDYMLFCETVLDPSEIKSRLYEAKAQDKATKLDRSKQFLGSNSNRASARTALGKGSTEAGMQVQGAAFASTQPPQPQKAHRLHVDKRDDEILKRFQAAQQGGGQGGQGQRAYSSGGGAMGYNSAGAAAAPLDEAFDRHNPANANVAKSSSNAQRSDWNTDDLYRVARTQGQASRESARGRDGVSVRDAPKSATVPISQSQSYASSHSRRGSQSRLKWG